MNVTITIPHKSKRLLFRLSSVLFALVGVACLGWWLFVYLQARIYAGYEEHRLDQALIHHEAVRYPPPASPGDFIGQIDIPRLGLKAIVLEGADSRTLRLGVGHIPGTALPGENGNVSLAGHRDTVFRGLRRIHRNDVIDLTTFAGTSRYVVDWAEVVPPRDTGVLKPDGRPILTLVTCYPFYYVGPAPDRFVVRAHEIPGSPL